MNLHVKVAYLKGKPFAGLEAIVTSLSYRRDESSATLYPTSSEFFKYVAKFLDLKTDEEGG